MSGTHPNINSKHPEQDAAGLAPPVTGTCDYRGPLAVYLDGLSPGSRPTVAQSLEVVARYLSQRKVGADRYPWGTVTYAQAQAARAYVAKRYAPATARKVVSALRGVLRRAWRLGLMSTDEYLRAADLEPVTGTAVPPGRRLGLGEIRALFDACAADQTGRGARDAAIIAVLVGTGIRRREAVDLAVASVNFAAGELEVVGKGARARRVPLPAGTVAAVEAWLDVRGRKAGPLFYTSNAAGGLYERPLTGSAVYRMLARRRAQAGIATLSPHDFRRSFVSDLLDAGVDLAVVQRLVGHSGINTTARYDRRGEQAARAAVDLRHVPYTPRERQTRR